MELNKVLERVRKLVNQAEHPDTEKAEADKFRTKADQLMLDYAIEQADLDATRPADQRSAPEVLKLDIIRANSPVRRYIVRIISAIADHCRCRVVLHHYFPDNSINDDPIAGGLKIKGTVMGYQSDLRYFELLFTIVQLHFSGAVDPRPDSRLSFDENCYRMHEAGITYRKMVHMLFPEEVSGWITEQEIRKLGGRCKSGYRRACKKRGEEPRRIPNPDVYQQSFAKAYAVRIVYRLAIMAGSQSGGRSTALVRRTETVDEKLRELFPNLNAIEEEEEDQRTDRVGSLAGDQAAGEVDLAGPGMSGSASRKPLG